MPSPPSRVLQAEGPPRDLGHQKGRRACVGGLGTGIYGGKHFSIWATEVIKDLNTLVKLPSPWRPLPSIFCSCFVENQMLEPDLIAQFP